MKSPPLAAVDHLGISRRDPLADDWALLEHGRRKAPLGQGVSAGQAHSPGPNDNRIEIEIRHSPLGSRCAARWKHAKALGSRVAIA
mgnify:CR=1 FL=1